MGSLHHLDQWRVAIDLALLRQCRRLSARCLEIRHRCGQCHRSVDRQYSSRIHRLRRPVPHPAGGAGPVVYRHGDPAVDGLDLGTGPVSIGSGDLYSHRRADRYLHGGQCLHHHYSRPAFYGQRNCRRTGARPRSWDSWQATLDPQQLRDPTGDLYYAQQSLCLYLQPSLRLAGVDGTVCRWHVDSPLFQFTASR